MIVLLLSPFQIESHLALLEMLPEGSRAHNHVRRVLNHVAGLGGGPAADGQPNNGHHTESSTTATPSTSAAPVSTPTRALRDTTSPSRSVGKGHGRPATSSPSTNAATGHGPHATTPRVVTTPSLLAPISHTSPQLEVHPPIPDASPPMVDASPQPEVPSPTPPSQLSFDLGINFHLTPPIHPETPSYPPTCSSAPAIPIDPPTSSSSDPLGPSVRIDIVQPVADVLDEHPPPQPKVPSPSPPLQHNFDLNIDQNLTPPIFLETPSYPPTSSTAPTPGLYIEHHYPPTASSSDPLGPSVGIDTPQPHTDVPDEHSPHQPSPPQGRPQRTRRAPTCGTGGHKIGHRGTAMV